MTRFVVEPLPILSYVVRKHEGDHPAFRTSCVVCPDGPLLTVKLMHGPLSDIPAWIEAASEHFPEAEWLRFWRMQPDGTLKQYDRRLR